jgi:integrase
MTITCTVFNHTIATHPDETHLFPNWPLSNKAIRKPFFKGCEVRERRGYLELSILPAWWDATQKLATLLSNTWRDGEGYRDYYRFLLLTGMRRDEALKLLKCSGVNFETDSLYLPTTKNKKPLRIPMSSVVREMLWLYVVSPFGTTDTKF